LKYLYSLPTYWHAWLRNPRAMGSIAPSSERLACSMLQALPANDSAAVIELGGGTGAITRILLQSLGSERLLVVERDKDLLAGLRQRWPALQLLCGDAAKLDSLLPDRPHHYAAIVSGLPMLNMRRQACQDIVRACFATLPTDGVLIQFSYGWRSPVPTALMHSLNLRAERCGTVWHNLPPASVWRYTRLAG